ncbi:MAG: hypothetical protein N2490_07405 [Ignavibacteria bacterium]|nr:hypothetical protein [Ignavibacteria bacterium]
MKIISVLLKLSIIFLLQSCNWDDNTLPPPPPEPSTGMWFVGSLSTDGNARYVKSGIINQNQFAFLATGEKGLKIININDGSNPTLTSSYNTGGFVQEVLVDTIDNNIYAFLSDKVKGLFIINISNPASPTLDTNISYTAGVNSVEIKNNYLFVALGSTSVNVLNIDNIQDSVYEVFTYTPKNIVEHIEVSGNIAYFIERITGIEIVDVSNPNTPVFLTTFKSPGNCYDIKVAGDLAYIADGTSGVTVISVANPAQPYFIRIKDLGTDVRALDYSPNFLFAAEYTDGVEVMNLFNPTNPDPFGYYEPEGICYSIDYFKAKVLVANGTRGLLILRY